ncbi:MAG: nicotinamide mononucleotide transporter [Ruminococcaceae bacterium]|nr:nicotinamide mononucleotide transporter [Oscillospiraceae bacterium]
MLKRLCSYFTLTERLLWLCSCIAIITVFIIFDRESFLTLTASLIGVTSLIFSAKGNPAGLVLMVIFSIIYGIISFSFAYYGEMITYLCMTMPMSAYALICWLKNPYGDNRAEVRISSLGKTDFVILPITTLIVTVAFYFILAALDTTNVIPSTISVTTSFVAIYLTARRSPFFALAYASNDIVLIILWILAAMENSSYVSVVICFAVFLINDLYGFINWNRMKKRQRGDVTCTKKVGK